MLYSALFFLLVIIYCVRGDCDYVNKGDFYANGQFLNYWGSRSSNYQIREYSMDANCANYSWPEGFAYPSGYTAQACVSSWNKLYGGGRCGIDHHDFSDRFVWRRHIECVKFEANGAISEVPNCPKAGQIQLAAYAYDLGNLPYQNDSLLTIFTNTVKVNEKFVVSISYAETSATYTLLGSVASGMNVLETHTIKHTACADMASGLILGFYFGGSCSAPQKVTTCYTDVSSSTPSPTPKPTPRPSSSTTSNPASSISSSSSSPSSTSNLPSSTTAKPTSTTSNPSSSPSSSSASSSASTSPSSLSSSTSGPTSLPDDSARSFAIAVHANIYIVSILFVFCYLLN